MSGVCCFSDTGDTFYEKGENGMKNEKKIQKLSAVLFLMIALAFLVLPARPVHASDGWGTCGDKITWYYHDNSGWLEIKGTGEMTSVPWKSYKGQVKKVTISSGITSVSDYAFYECRNLTSVTLPKSIKTLGKSAFVFTGIRTVNLPEGLTHMGSGCFNFCSALTTVKIPNSIKVLENYTFSNCENLKTVTLSNNLQSIGERCFKGCGVTSIKFPASLRSIGTDAFSGTDLFSVVVPSTVTTVYPQVFMGCHNLRYAEFYAKCGMEAWLFSGTNLEVIKIGAGVPYINATALGSSDRKTHIYITSSTTKMLAELWLRNYYIYAKKGSVAWQYCGKISNATFVDIESSKGLQSWRAAVGRMKTYKVSFVSSGKTISTNTVYYDDKIKEPKAPKKKGYLFAGWYNGSKKYNFNTKIRSNLTLKAKWTKVTVGKAVIKRLSNPLSGRVDVELNDLKWNKGYEVQYSYSSNFKNKHTVSKSMKYVVFYGTKNKTVYIRARAYKFDSVGNKIYGAFSSTKKIKIK